MNLLTLIIVMFGVNQAALRSTFGPEDDNTLEESQSLFNQSPYKETVYTPQNTVKETKCEIIKRYYIWETITVIISLIGIIACLSIIGVAIYKVMDDGNEVNWHNLSGASQEFISKIF